MQVARLLGRLCTAAQLLISGAALADEDVLPYYSGPQPVYASPTYTAHVQTYRTYRPAAQHRVEQFYGHYDYEFSHRPPIVLTGRIDTSGFTGGVGVRAHTYAAPYGDYYAGGAARSYSYGYGASSYSAGTATYRSFSRPARPDYRYARASDYDAGYRDGYDNGYGDGYRYGYWYGVSRANTVNRRPYYWRHPWREGFYQGY